MYISKKCSQTSDIECKSCSSDKISNENGISCKCLDENKYVDEIKFVCRSFIMSLLKNI